MDRMFAAAGGRQAELADAARVLEGQAAEVGSSSGHVHAFVCVCPLCMHQQTRGKVLHCAHDLLTTSGCWVQCSPAFEALPRPRGTSPFATWHFTLAGQQERRRLCAGHPEAAERGGGTAGGARGGLRRLLSLGSRLQVDFYFLCMLAPEVLPALSSVCTGWRLAKTGAGALTCDTYPSMLPLSPHPGHEPHPDAGSGQHGAGHRLPAAHRCPRTPDARPSAGGAWAFFWCGYNGCWGWGVWLSAHLLDGLPCTAACTVRLSCPNSSALTAQLVVPLLSHAECGGNGGVPARQRRRGAGGARCARGKYPDATAGS